MRAEHLVRYDGVGRPHLAVTSLDAPFVLSAYLEHAEHNGWHFAYTKDGQREIAELIDGAPDLRRALLFAWPEAADPGEDGGLPGRYLDLIVERSTSWAVFHTGTREGRIPLRLLTVGEQGAVRLGARAIYSDRPFLPAEQIRAAAVEYIRTGELPEVVGWQRPAAVAPQGPFGRATAVQQERLDWAFPERARHWVADPIGG